MREIIKMTSTGKTVKGKPTGTFYTTKKKKKKKNKKKTTEKLKLKRFDQRAYNAKTQKTGMYVLFEEGKV